MSQTLSPMPVVMVWCALRMCGSVARAGVYRSLKPNTISRRTSSVNCGPPNFHSAMRREAPFRPPVSKGHFWCLVCRMQISASRRAAVPQHWIIERAAMRTRRVSGDRAAAGMVSQI